MTLIYHQKKQKNLIGPDVRIVLQWKIQHQRGKDIMAQRGLPYEYEIKCDVTQEFRRAVSEENCPPDSIFRIKQRCDDKKVPQK